ncbi:uncharacterized protein MKS88_000037 [Plasmodium brasilianum]|uniref:uncharacterized protein n=1 Tax=Plasmodium brasilianum TaxID=5824 RepID=UPI00350E4BC3|nr:hypothetical protein MKS88_000037 [Plasmodium brasilianum]
MQIRRLPTLRVDLKKKRNNFIGSYDDMLRNIAWLIRRNNELCKKERIEKQKEERRKKKEERRTKKEKKDTERFIHRTLYLLSNSTKDGINHGFYRNSCVKSVLLSNNRLNKKSTPPSYAMLMMKNCFYFMHNEKIYRKQVKRYSFYKKIKNNKKQLYSRAITAVMSMNISWTLYEDLLSELKKYINNEHRNIEQEIIPNTDKYTDEYIYDTIEQFFKLVLTMICKKRLFMLFYELNERSETFENRQCAPYNNYDKANDE